MAGPFPPGREILHQAPAGTDRGVISTPGRFGFIPSIGFLIPHPEPACEPRVKAVCPASPLSDRPPVVLTRPGLFASQERRTRICTPSAPRAIERR